MKTIITTRHSSFADYLIRSGIAPADAVFLPRAGADDIRGCRVIGPLPIHLAALAYEWIHVPVDMRDLPRDHELTPEELAERVGEPVVYTVRTGSPVRVWHRDQKVEGTRERMSEQQVFISREPPPGTEGWGDPQSIETSIGLHGGAFWD